MAKRRVMFELAFANEADGLTVKTAIESFLLGKSLFESEISAVYLDGKKGSWLLHGSVRFNLPTDGDAWYTDIKSKWSAGVLKNKFLSGSRISIHDCNHEEAIIRPCTDPLSGLTSETKV